MYDRREFRPTHPHPGPRSRGDRYDRGYRGYDAPFRSARPDAGPRAAPYGGDYWLLGERELLRQGYRDRYDDAYRRFDERARPRYSPVGGMYPATGGYRSGPDLPRPVRENTRFSDWTRWF